MLIGILDLLLKTGAEVRAKKNEEESIANEKEIESTDVTAEKEGSWLLGLFLISLPIYLLAYWLIGLDFILINILGYVLFSIPVLFILLIVIFKIEV